MLMTPGNEAVIGRPCRTNRLERVYAEVSRIGNEGCTTAGMVDEQGDERRGAQQETPSEREAKKNPAKQQDLEKPPEGRDEPPAETMKRGKRNPESPWMGGG